MTDIDELRTQLDQWKSELGNLEHKIRQTYGDHCIERRSELYHLRRDHINLHKQLDDLVQAKDDAKHDAWGHDTDRLERLKSRFVRNLNQVSARFK